MVEGGGASLAAGGAGPLKADSGQKNCARGPIQATSLQRDTHHAPGRHEGHRQVQQRRRLIPHKLKRWVVVPIH